MFYLIIAILIVLYYLFVASKTIKNTMNMIMIVAIISFAVFVIGMGAIKLMESPPEIYVILGMLIAGFYIVKDVVKLSSKIETKDSP
ncbi:DUF3165 family protein [Streptococcus sp. CSL10205-OR2]|uniref:DUF3165 family protein n=1 Tax=Streptococcus sp. CSL10205-OR2 TaxID=2980558 RepID=UPI0021DA36F2|nr:DUF3165 family protein [Streptococcus sp. CSL10205-OR2]MCU9533459.1 DUF3165 family protein [Streptococcus sp. CSL10205-OR2]